MVIAAAIVVVWWCVNYLFLGFLRESSEVVVDVLLTLALAVVGWQAWKEQRHLADHASILHFLLAQSPDCMMILTEQGTILEVNQRSTTLLGYQPDELASNTFRALVHPDERNMVNRLLGQLTVSEIGTCCRATLHIIHRNQRCFSAEIALTLQQLGKRRYILLSLRDASEQHRQERKIRRVLHTLDRIIRTIPQTVIIIDLTKERVVYAGNTHVIGWSAVDLTRISLEEFFDKVHPADRDQFEECVRRATMLSDGSNATCVYSASNGEKRWRSYYVRIATFKRNTQGAVEQLLMVVDDITALMEERSKREQLHERMQLATRGAGIGVWEIDLQTLEPYWDEMMYMMHGIPTDIRGRELTKRWFTQLSCESRKHVLRILARLTRGQQQQVDSHYEITNPAGEQRHLRFVATLERSALEGRNRLIGIVIDETELHRRRLQQQKLELLLEESQRMARIGSWETDMQAGTFTCSKELWNIIGVPPRDGLTQIADYASHVYPEDVEHWKAALEHAVTQKESFSFCYRIVRENDRSVRWIRCYGMPIVSGDRLVAYRGTIQDITEQYNQEQQLIQAREEALHASRVKSEFLANMSHEIRTPMNAILGFASLLEQTVTEPLQREYIAAIRSGGQTLLQLINDILDLSKLEAGRMRLCPEPTDLRVFIEEVRMFLSERAMAKGLDLRTELIGVLPRAVELDTVRVRQILFNLVGNAIKFTERGSVTLRVFGNKNQDESWRLILEVEDTGIGIPEDQLEAIFEAFQQVEGQSTRKYGGTGLGLAICKRLTELMGGTISVRSVVGSGSVFTVVLPQVREAQVEEGALRQQVSVPRINFDGAVVVVVDDIESNRALVRSYLEFHDAVVHEAASADEAERLIGIVKPTAVFTDIHMPKRSGIELAQKLRQSEQWRSLPVVAVTASPIGVPEHAALFDAVLLKPITLETFLEAACKVLSCVSESIVQQNVEVSEDDEQESLPLEDLEAIRPQWQRAVERFVTSDIEQFITALEILAERSSSARLRRYLHSVQHAYKRFDIVALRHQLERYQRLIEPPQYVSVPKEQE